MQANSLRRGMAILKNGQILLITDFTHRTPGNKRAFVQVTVKNISTGQITQDRYSATEDVELAHLDPKKTQYLYHDREGFHFMDLADYHTFQMSEEMLGDSQYYLKENMEVEIMFCDDKPIQINLPRHVILTVVDSPPGIKGDSVSSNNKPAVLETGLRINVPLFVTEGTQVKVDTKTGEYLGRE
ncbi:MAG: elongation factor P [Candidatus Omnitrophica bacterium CG11_big_fil_rev_8_21_14_0_20_45_26]|uniref:Elongation factor P n=1 Tax=Candidatus Abzuiibacterium crystallinum TaxID=1974748 RepID=A0A2H0LQ27_9BACT|nr:MAG: elongation factor P [Candidatus Omnitrophica bacterium CG11_big_fil_rev_8_21_14_0_20_45_26]PIW64276.1 MAG: elongation factor P [Candidatus Omnitrophica bacterium CG12_big_fil_rev_8_21_14_0_65_45_16]